MSLRDFFGVLAPKIEYPSLNPELVEIDAMPQVTETKDFLLESKEELLKTLKLLDCKINLPVNISAVIVAGIDIDPASSVNSYVIKNYADTIDKGIKLLKILTNKKIILAVADNIGNSNNIKADSIINIKAVHPNGMPQLVKNFVAKKENLDGDIAYIDSEYLFSIVKTLETNTKSNVKLITVSGNGIKNVKLVSINLGSKISKVLENLEINVAEGSKVLSGGLMLGAATYDFNSKIDWTCDSIYIQAKKNIIESESNACISCGKCVNVCPENLQVDMLARFAEYSLFEEAESEQIEDCMACGMCAFVCPARRPLVHMIDFAKIEIQKAKEELALANN